MSVEYARALLPEGEAWHGRHENWAAVQALVERLEGLQLPPYPRSRVWFGWEPLPALDFLEGISMCADALGRDGGRLQGARFLDVGSGIGSKLLIAAELGWRPMGIERYAPYAQASRRLFSELPVFIGEAADFERYAEYDAVYCYRLARQEDDQEALNALIVERMREGALFWCVGPPFPEGLEHVGGLIWRK